MVVLRGGVFLMSEVPLYVPCPVHERVCPQLGRNNHERMRPLSPVARPEHLCTFDQTSLQGYLAHKKQPPLGPYGRDMPWALWRS